MKKVFAIAIATFFLSTAINAQVKRNVEPTQRMQRDRTHSKMKNDFSQLNLNQEQKEKMKGVLQDAKQQREAIKNDASLSQEQRVAKMKELRQVQKQKVDGILTPAQKAQQKENFQKRKDNRTVKGQGHKTGIGQGNKGGRGQGNKGGKAQFRKNHKNQMASLDLSQAQKDQLKNYREDRKQKSIAIKNDASLTPEQKKAKMKDLRTDAYSKMQKILTPEQRAKVKANRGKGKYQK